MATDIWPTKRRSVATLHVDEHNPRLGRDAAFSSPNEIIQYLFEHDKAIDVAESIASRGYFPNEPLLGIKENGKTIIVEGNRRLASLKALREPNLLDGTYQRKVERLSRQIHDIRELSSVPVTLAPSRRATDRQIAGRHIGTPVLAWQAENRASFILAKLSEGYTDDQIRDQLGFTTADIQTARQTRAITDMARSIEFPDAVKQKLDNPRAKLFSTLERVFDSSVGRSYLLVVPDAEHGFKGQTTKKEFLRGFKKLVTDVALGNESSRTLNSSENIEAYFKKWNRGDLPQRKQGRFVPEDIIQNARSKRSNVTSPSPTIPPAVRASTTVLPTNFKVRYGNPRLKEIRDELTKLQREKNPNAGAVLLRVFFELSVIDYLTRTGQLSQLIAQLEKKEGRRIPHGTPTLKQLVPTLKKVAKNNLSTSDATKVEKAVRYDAAAPFTISELHGFVHQHDLPSARDIQQFWIRTEPLFRLMLETDCSGHKL